MNPKISVIMPFFNVEQTIKRAINSILNQSLTDFEFILIDDGSEDKSLEVAKEFNDPRIKIVSVKHQGISKCLNLGIDLAVGKYIARMDADDYSYPKRFEKQFYYLEQNPDIGVLGTNFRVVDNDKSYIEQTVHSPSLEDMLKRTPFGHPTVMIRKSVLDEYNFRYSTEYCYAEDLDLWTRMASVTKFANLQDILLDYYLNQSSVSKRFWRTQLFSTELIRLNIARKLKLKNHLLTYVYDDTNILNVLSELDDFAYLKNSGNIGDMFIASATMSWFDRRNIKWHPMEKNEQPRFLVYGGGGAWIHEWISGLKPIMDKMKLAEKVVILPSSFNEVPEFLQILDERFTIFCREKKSYDYLMSANTEAKILLDHDMAFRFRYIRDIGEIKKSDKYIALSQNLLNKVAQLPKDVKLFRIDNESYGHYPTDFDISDSCGWFSPYESRDDVDFITYTFLSCFDHFSKISTDRLHVGIAAALKGIETDLYDNSYGKVSGVYRNSLTELPYIHLK